MERGGELEKLVRNYGSAKKEDDGKEESSKAKESGKDKEKPGEKKSTSQSKIIAVEERNVGSVSWYIYKKYLYLNVSVSLIKDCNYSCSTLNIFPSSWRISRCRPHCWKLFYRILSKSNCRLVALLLDGTARYKQSRRT